jgi:hypothetical protein
MNKSINGYGKSKLGKYKHRYGYLATIIASLILGAYIQHLAAITYDEYERVMTVYHQQAKIPDIIKEYVPAMTPMNVLAEVCKQDITEPLIVFKQIMLETNNLACDNCSLDSNNLFGFRNMSGYIKFNTWPESIKYYKQWQEERLRPNENYYQFLLRVKFAEDSNYISKLKSQRY